MKIKYKIFINGKHTITCNEGEPLLRALSKQNIEGITFGCFGGGCGQCKVQVISGTYIAHRKMSKAHIPSLSDEKILACCITPCSDLQIELI